MNVHYEQQFTAALCQVCFWLRKGYEFEAGRSWERARYLSWKITNTDVYCKAQDLLNAFTEARFYVQGL